MIDPKDLRIGNYLNYKGKPVQVESIDPQRTLPELSLSCSIHIKDMVGDYCTGTTGKWLNHFEPIELIPEWLKKGGFVKDRNGWNLPQTQFSLTDNLRPCWLDKMLWPGGIPDFHLFSLKYLHRLQNIYYWLSDGKELTIKL